MGTPAAVQTDHVLLRRFAADREPGVREELVRRYLPLARRAARHYARSPQAFEDLFQIASVGLVKALDRYDPERATAFSTFALPTMTGELRRYFRDRTWAVRPPRGLQEHAFAVERAANAHAVRNGRMPTVAELADSTALTPQEVLDGREALEARHAVSLAAPALGAVDDDDATIETLLGRCDEALERVEDRALLRSVLGCLTRRELEVLRLRYVEDLTQREVGQRIGVSQMQVSRILRDALGKLRDALDADAP